MSGDAGRIAEELKDSARRHTDAASRRAAALEVLRRALDGSPLREALATLAEVRGRVAPGEGGEAGSLWRAIGEIVARGGALGSQPPGNVDGRRLARAVLGEEWAPSEEVPEEKLDRLLFVLQRLVEVLSECDRVMRDFNLELRKRKQMGRAGDTMMGIRLETPIPTLLARAARQGGDLAQLEKQVRRFALFGQMLFRAHDVSVDHATEAVRQRIDPQLLQREHGGDAWQAYRRIYKNDLFGFGPEFREAFVTERFLDEYFAAFQELG